MYTVRGRSAATAATADHAIAQLWNAHSTQRIRCVQFSVQPITDPGANAGMRLKRSTARGTAGSTVTPNIDNHSESAVAPVSGALLDLAAFSVQPTLASAELGPDFHAASSQGSVFIYDIPGGIAIPPGTGLVLSQAGAFVFAASTIHFVWFEDN